MAEFNSEESANTFEERYRTVAPPALPEANSLTMIRTGTTSMMSVALYPDIETANSTLQARKDMLEEFFGHIQGPMAHGGRGQSASRKKLKVNLGVTRPASGVFEQRGRWSIRWFLQV